MRYGGQGIARCLPAEAAPRRVRENRLTIFANEWGIV